LTLTLNILLHPALSWLQIKRSIYFLVLILIRFLKDPNPSLSPLVHYPSNFVRSDFALVAHYSKKSHNYN